MKKLKAAIDDWALGSPWGVVWRCFPDLGMICAALYALAYTAPPWPVQIICFGMVLLAALGMSSDGYLMRKEQIDQLEGMAKNQTFDGELQRYLRELEQGGSPDDRTV